MADYEKLNRISMFKWLIEMQWTVRCKSEEVLDMKMGYFGGSLIAALVLSACAQQPSAIAPAEVSRSAYSGASCRTLAKQLYSVETRLGELSAAQAAEAKKDAAWVAGGALLFFPVMAVAAAGEDHAGEIAKLKGQKNALNEQIIVSNC